jgi:hypothetical protein
MAHSSFIDRRCCTNGTGGGGGVLLVINLGGLCRAEPLGTPVVGDCVLALDEHPGRPLEPLEPQQLEDLRGGRAAGSMQDREFPLHVAPFPQMRPAPPLRPPKPERP